MHIGLNDDELQAMIARRMEELDAAQEDEAHLGPYGDLLRTAAIISYNRAAELILANNRRIAKQLQDAGVAHLFAE
jgi:hypothetical protein